MILGTRFLMQSAVSLVVCSELTPVAAGKTCMPTARLDLATNFLGGRKEADKWHKVIFTVGIKVKMQRKLSHSCLECQLRPGFLLSSL